MTTPNLRPLPQPHIAIVDETRGQASRGFREWLESTDRIIQALKKFVDNDEPYVPDFATIEDVFAAAGGGKLLTSEILESASQAVAITDGSSPVFDWSAGINRRWVVSANREVPNPINVQPGTWRTILLSGNSGTNRTISFDSNFKGDIPSVVVNSTNWVLVSVYAVATDHLLVSVLKAAP